MFEYGKGDINTMTVQGSVCYFWVWCTSCSFFEPLLSGNKGFWNSQ